MLTEADLAQLAIDIRVCEACSVRPEAFRPVPGIGNPDNGILFIGRNPGQEEDRYGEPFIGPAGKVLDGFLTAAGLTRGDIFLTNLVCCHTTKDRVPRPAEISTCATLHLRRYLTGIQPWLVVTFGAEAALAVGRIKPLTQHHGMATVHQDGYILIPAYHPAAPLHNPALRGALGYDAAQVRRTILHKAEMLDLIKAQRTETA